MTYEQFLELTKRPYYEANAAMSGEPRLTEYKARFTGRVNPDVGWFMHPHDHYAALKTLNGGDPTWAEVWGSLFSGSGNIDRAWRMTAIAADGAPEDWPLPDSGGDAAMRDFTRKLIALRLHHSYSVASNIAEGKRRDPNPQRTAELMASWDAIRRNAPAPIQPPPPEPQQPTLPPLSPPDVRVEELRALVLGFLEDSETTELLTARLRGVPITLRFHELLDLNWPAWKPLAVALLRRWRIIRKQLQNDPRDLP